jgi:hypothetical protein
VLNCTNVAYPTAVNNQITDAVTQANVTVLADAPAQAIAALYQATAQALANAAHNATSGQQNTSILAQAVVTACVRNLLGDQPAKDT